jgi:cell division septum initiation protein DivIVA
MLQADYSQNNQIHVQQPEASENLDNHSQANFNIQIELDNLEELILGGANVPLTELTILDAGLLLEQLNQIKASLPVEFTTAIEIVNRSQEIIAEAEGYAYLIVQSAEEKAIEMVQESAIVRQAELDGAKIRLKTEQECEHLKQTTKNEIEQWRQEAIAECEIIQKEADRYAESVLGDLEQKLQEMLTVVQNGRQQLQAE